MIKIVVNHTKPIMRQHHQLHLAQAVQIVALAVQGINHLRAIMKFTQHVPLGFIHVEGYKTQEEFVIN